MKWTKRKKSDAFAEIGFSRIGFYMLLVKERAKSNIIF